MRAINDSRAEADMLTGTRTEYTFTVAGSRRIITLMPSEFLCDTDQTIYRLIELKLWLALC